tara:strand:- start:2561 stop:2875 length:315 start_codon:yes stop_codon:yes gene_type:complete
MIKKLHSASEVIEIRILKSLLEEADIQCFTKNEFPPMAGEIPKTMAWPELWINSDYDLDKAKLILKDFLNRPNRSADKWICPKCQEKLEEQFDICWSCGATREP